MSGQVSELIWAGVNKKETRGHINTVFYSWTPSEIMLLSTALFLLSVHLCLRASPGKSPGKRSSSDSFGSDVHASDFDVSTNTESPTQLVLAYSTSSEDGSVPVSGDVGNEFVSGRRRRRASSENSIKTREALMREMSRVAGSRFGISELISEGSGKDPEEEYLHKSDFDTSSDEKVDKKSYDLDSGETTEEDDTFDDEVWTVEPTDSDNHRANGYRRRESVEEILRVSLRNNRKDRVLQRSQNPRKKPQITLSTPSDGPSNSVDITETEGIGKYELNSRFFSYFRLEANESETTSKIRRAKSDGGSNMTESTTGPTTTCQEGETGQSSTALSPDTAHRQSNPRWRKVSPGYKPSVSVSRTPSPKEPKKSDDSDKGEDLS